MYAYNNTSPAPLLKTILTPTEYAYYETIREKEFKASEAIALTRILEIIFKMSPEARQWFMHKSEDFTATVNLLASLSLPSLHKVRAVARNQFYEEQTADEFKEQRPKRSIDELVVKAKEEYYKEQAASERNANQAT